MTKRERTIALLKRGWLTSLESANRGGCLSLSQRCGDFRREMCWIDFGTFGHRFKIAEKWVDLPSGSRVKAWRIVKDYKIASDKKGCV